jgi:hypothetical protein
MEAVKPMKRFLLGVTILGAAAFLGGCPIYSSHSSQYGEYQFCNATGCYSCPDPAYSSACVPWPCRSDSDCETSGYVCSDYGQGGGRCVPGSTTGPMSGVCSVPSDCAAGYTCGQDGTCMIQLVPIWTATTSTTGMPDRALLDVGADASMPGAFNVAMPPVTSQTDLRLTITLNPTSDHSASPTLIDWTVKSDCMPSE